MSAFVEFDTGPLAAAIQQALDNHHLNARDRRDRFAAAALIGLLSSDYAWAAANAKQCGETSVELADALIKELDRG